MALSVGPERAVRSAVAELGEDAVVRAAPLLQTVALTRPTRVALKAKENDGLLRRLRDEVAALRPSTERVAPVELRRITLRSVIMVVGLLVAAYVILPQFAKVDFGNVLATAQWGWAAACVGFAVLTFAGASMALNGAVRIHLSFVRTYMTQLAVAFSGLVAPAAVGNIALNTRYLQTSGLPPAVAGAGVGVAQVAQFCSYVILLLISGVLAGTGPRASFTPPPLLVAGILLVVLVVLGLLAVPKVRAVLTSRVLPPLKAAVPQVLAVFQTPTKLAQLIGGALILDASFVAALVCATRAFGVGDLDPRHRGRLLRRGDHRLGRADARRSGRHRGGDVGRPHRHRGRQRHGGVVGAALPARHLLAADPVRLVLPPAAPEGRRDSRRYAPAAVCRSAYGAAVVDGEGVEGGVAEGAVRWRWAWPGARRST